MSEIVPIDGEAPKELDEHDVRIQRTRAIRDRVASSLLSIYDEMIRPFEKPGAEGKALPELEGFDKVTKLLLKSLGDNDKVDLTLKRISADQAMNDSNLKSAQAITEAMLRRLGQMQEHPLAAGNIIDVEATEVSADDLDKRLGISNLDKLDDIEFNPGVLIQGRVEESSDAFYARMAQLSAQVTEEVRDLMGDPENQAGSSN